MPHWGDYLWFPNCHSQCTRKFCATKFPWFPPSLVQIIIWETTEWYSCNGNKHNQRHSVKLAVFCAPFLTFTAACCTNRFPNDIPSTRHCAPLTRIFTLTLKSFRSLPILRIHLAFSLKFRQYNEIDVALCLSRTLFQTRKSPIPPN